MKQAWTVSEKQWKKNWIEKKQKEIKEMTIKGLEPEIERILKNSREKVRKLQESTKGTISKKTAEIEKKFEK
jgi:uncharacterized protein YktB (UPF0637 family)